MTFFPIWLLHPLSALLVQKFVRDSLPQRIPFVMSMSPRVHSGEGHRSETLPAVLYLLASVSRFRDYGARLHFFNDERVCSTYQSDGIYALTRATKCARQIERVSHYRHGAIAVENLRGNTPHKKRNEKYRTALSQHYRNYRCCVIAKVWTIPESEQ